MKRISDSWKKLSNSVKLLSISILIYVIILIIHFIYVRFINPDYGQFISDQVVFFNRGKNIIQGQLPYRDFSTNAAPLSPFLWASFVLISMIGSGDFTAGIVDTIGLPTLPSMILFSYVLRLFFALCLVLSGLVLLKIEERRNNKHAFLLSLFYTVNPFFLYLVSFWGSDECIVPLLILLPIYLFERGNNSLGTLSIILGTGFKYFPILLAPLILIYSKRWLDRIIQILIFIVSLLLITLPFYLISPEGFLNQFKDLPSEQGNQGLYSVIQGYFGISLNQYNLIFQVIAAVLVCLAGIYLIIKIEKWQYQKTAIILLVFLLAYPKIQVSYIVLIFPFIFSTFFLKGFIKWVSLTLLVFGSAMGESHLYS